MYEDRLRFKRESDGTIWVSFPNVETDEMKITSAYWRSTTIEEAPTATISGVVYNGIMEIVFTVEPTG